MIFVCFAFFLQVRQKIRRLYWREVPFSDCCNWMLLDEYPCGVVLCFCYSQHQCFRKVSFRQNIYTCILLETDVISVLRPIQSGLYSTYI